MFSRPTCVLLATLSLVLIGTVRGWAQSTGAGLGRSNSFGTATWLQLSSDARLTNRWGTHAEAQWRRAVGGTARQNLLRLGLNFHASGALILSAGYAHVLTSPAGDLPATPLLPEHRIYEQLIINDLQGRLRLQHRYRFEQRWVQGPNQAPVTYLNRVRYQVHLAYPLSAPVLKPGGAYLVAANELFLGFGANVQHGIFDQNRAYAALGCQITKALAVEAGYLNQLRQPTGLADFGSTHSVQVSLAFNPDFRPDVTLAATQPQ